MSNEFRVGDIVEHMYGYSMVLYEFFRVVRVSESSIWYQRLPKKCIGTDYMTPDVIPDISNFSGEIIRKSKKTYMGSRWDGKPCKENHWD